MKVDKTDKLALTKALSSFSTVDDTKETEVDDDTDDISSVIDGKKITKVAKP